MRFRLFVAGGTFFALLGCAAPEPGMPWAPTGDVPAAEQRPGDPVEGYRALVNEAYVTCGIPYSAYAQVAPIFPPEAYLTGREGRSDELPYMLTAFDAPSGVEIVTTNCLSCHASTFNGELVIGLGNEFLDFTDDPAIYAEGVGILQMNEAERKEWRKWADRIVAIAPYGQADVLGVNPADNLTAGLASHRDPETLEWSEELLLAAPPTKVTPVSVPPWWRMRKKNAMFYLSGGRGDHARYMMMASTFCTDSVDEAAAIDSYFPHIRAYIASLEAPVYPFAIDSALADAGKPIFEANCSRCHGTYDAGAHTYPNQVISLAEVGTDPKMVHEVETHGYRYLEWFNASFYGELAHALPARGYVAPPLDGVWATAPFLHNGSVPTIETLLDSTKRPTYWTRSFTVQNFDQNGLGWVFTELGHGHANEPDRNVRKTIYDTTLPGYSNSGHTFGDALSDGDRSAVLEYLKTL